MKITMFFHWNYKYSDEPIPALFSCDMSSYGYLLVGEVEIECPDIPLPTREEVIAGKVKELREKQGVHQHEIDKIDEAIKSLLCIEYKPEITS